LKRNNLLDDGAVREAVHAAADGSRGKQGEFRNCSGPAGRAEYPTGILRRRSRKAAEAADPAGIIRQRIERKLRLYRGEIDERKMASLYRSLIGAGISFGPDPPRVEAPWTKEEVPEVDAPLEEKLAAGWMRGCVRGVLGQYGLAISLAP